MKNSQIKPVPDLSDLIKWVILFRVIFALLMILSCVIFSRGENLSFFSLPFLYLYNIAALILLLSIGYLIWLGYLGRHVFLGYTQTIVDTFIVTAVIYITGGYNSVFTFLYLLVIIYSAMILLRKGSLIVAALASFQYGILVELEYYSLITPVANRVYWPSPLDGNHVIYRIIIMIIACFAVAILSGILALQLKGAKQELKIAHEHLKRAEKMAAMDEMISGIAHEIKNPLASLSGSIQLLREDSKPGSYEDKLMQIILRETDRLKNIVNDIRLFAKPSTHNAKVTRLAPAIEDTVELFLNDPQCSQTIKVDIRLDPDISVLIDPTHLKQILWNLLKNAAQAMGGQGDITIVLKSHRGNRAYLTVADNGNGIPPDKISHIFDPFFTTKPDGTGLGLAIIHRIVDTYQGMIDVESSPGQGTIFSILLPSTSADIPESKS